MHIIAQVSLLCASEESWNINCKQKGSCIYLSIYFRCTRTDFINLSHSRLLAMIDARSCLKRLVSLSRLVNKCCWLLLGAPFECLQCFGSQRSSWETVSFFFATVATKLQPTYLETCWNWRQDSYAGAA